MRFSTRVVALFMSVFALVAQAQNLSIATGGTGGVYYPLGGGMAAVLSKYVPGMQATAEVTGGSVANLQLIGTGKPYLGMTMADATLDAYKGQDKFTGKPVPVRTLMVMYPNRMHVVSIEGAIQRTATVGEPITLSAIVTDDGIPAPRPAPRGSVGFRSSVGLRVAWFVYRGQGNAVTFDPEQIRPGGNDCCVS